MLLVSSICSYKILLQMGVQHIKKEITSLSKQERSLNDLQTTLNWGDFLKRFEIYSAKPVLKTSCSKFTV